MNKRTTILITIAIIVAWFILQGVKLPVFNSNPDRVVQSDTVFITNTVRDTVYQEIEIQSTDTLYYPEYVTKYLVDTVEVLVYADTVKLDENFSVSYNAHVEGKIRSINFGIIGKYPTVTETITEKETITNTVYPDAWYAGIFATPQTVGINITKTMDRHMFSLGYGLNKSMYLGYAYRIR